MPRAPSGPRSPLGLTVPFPLTLAATTGWDSASGSPSSLLAPPHHALSHHPVTEALPTAASRLGEKGSH